MRIDLRTSLVEALGVKPGELVSLVGAGGKTSLMYALGHELAALGRPVLVTTTTRIMYPAPAEAAHVVIGDENDATLSRLEAALAGARLVLAARAKLDSKLAGFSPAFLETIRRRVQGLAIVAECDGAKGKSLKVPRQHEPPVAPSTDVFVVLIGADCLGKPLSADEVFEGELVRAVAGVNGGAVVDSRVIARAVLSSESYLGRKPPGARLCVFLNKVDVENLDRLASAAGRTGATSAFEVGMALRSNAAVDRVVYGSLERSAGKGFLVLS
ncbi:MAG TPA: selenium cofactor biosynthesis protein YqeC [bacterium]|nr:selenium cofactor biosynthesis protein YqeC [bacterium]